MDRWRFLTSALVILVASSVVAAQPSGPTIAKFTITPPVIRPGDVAEIRLEHREAPPRRPHSAPLARPALGAPRLPRASAAHPPSAARPPPPPAPSITERTRGRPPPARVR